MDDMLRRATELLGSTPLVDRHNDLAWSVRENPPVSSTLGDGTALKRGEKRVCTDLTRL